MHKGIKKILFPTDLSKNCLPAFDYASLLSLRFRAAIVILHVKEKVPDYVEGRLQGLFGDEQWEEIRNVYENSIQVKLIGKQSTVRLIKAALEHLCSGDLPEGEGACEPREIVITGGDMPIPDAIIEASKTHDCDVIVMGSSKGVLSKQSAGSTLKSVMKHSTVPVIMVPHGFSIRDGLEA